MIVALEAFFIGLGRTFVRFKLVALLYGALLLFGLATFWPAYLLLGDDLAHSPALRTAAQGGFDFEALVDLENARRTELDLYGDVLTFVAVLFLLLQTFFKGGILFALCERGRLRLSELASASARYFVRFVRLLLLVGLALVGLHYLNVLLSELLYDLFVANESTFADLVLHSKTILMLLLLTGLVTVQGYASVQTVLEERRGMLASLVSSLIFCLKHPLRTGTMMLLQAALCLGALAAYVYLVQVVPVVTETLWTSLLATQGLVLVWCFARVHFHASQLALVRRSRVAPAAEPAADTTWEETDEGYPSLEREDVATL